MMGVRARWLGFLRRVDARRFAAQRADYFEYLQAVLRGAQGTLTLRELFERDALRYGPQTVRGRLSAAWARACDVSGGDLYLTWRGCFPADELALVRAAQAFGNARLLACFQALASHLDLLMQAQRLLWATLGVAALAVVVASLLWLAIPVWTVPALQQSFQSLPVEFQGAWTQALFVCARFLKSWGVALPLVVGMVVVGMLRTLRTTCGPLRHLLDRVGPWRLYRQVQAMRLFSLIAILLQTGPGNSIQLRPVVALFLQQAYPWLASHLRQMMRRIDEGLAGAAAFDTGLLDPELYWYLQDMAQARGLPQAIQMTHVRMASLWLPRLRFQAQCLRWAVLLCGVAMVLGIGLWHYAVIDELRRGWMMFHAGQ